MGKSIQIALRCQVRYSFGGWSLCVAACWAAALEQAMTFPSDLPRVLNLKTNGFLYFSHQFQDSNVSLLPSLHGDSSNGGSQVTMVNFMTRWFGGSPMKSRNLRIPGIWMTFSWSQGGRQKMEVLKRGILPRGNLFCCSRMGSPTPGVGILQGFPSDFRTLGPSAAHGQCATTWTAHAWWRAEDLRGQASERPGGYQWSGPARWDGSGELWML